MGWWWRGGGFVCFCAVPAEVTAIPALSQKHIHLCEKKRPVNSDERPRGLRRTGKRRTVRGTAAQTQQLPSRVVHAGQTGGQQGRQTGWKKKERKQARKKDVVILKYF